MRLCVSYLYTVLAVDINDDNDGDSQIAYFIGMESGILSLFTFSLKCSVQNFRIRR